MRQILFRDYLSESFYKQLVEPILARHLPQLKYSCALIGAGSEVLGFDTHMSSDHDWGPRLLLFVEESDRHKLTEHIESLLEKELPEKFSGVAVRYGLSKPSKDGSQTIQHRVEIFSIENFLKSYIDFDVHHPITAADWLSIPEQKLRSITAGQVFRDELGLEYIREKFAYYPDDVWLFLLASGWNRIEQEEHLMGRAGYVGDEIGSSLIAARLVRDIMRLCFLMNKQYAPYAKWFGTAFAQLPCAREFAPTLQSVLNARNWNEREKHLGVAYKYAASMHNRLQITPPLSEELSQFHDRPFWVISKGAYSQAITAQITSPQISRLVEKRLIGNIDQISDNTDILEDCTRRSILKNLYKVDLD